MWGQIESKFGSGRAWTPVAAILTILGLLPGMPHMIILPAAGVAGYAAWRLRKGPAQAEESDAAETPEVEKPAQIDWDDVSDGATLGLEIGYGLIGLVDERKGEPQIGREHV